MIIIDASILLAMAAIIIVCVKSIFLGRVEEPATTIGHAEGEYDEPSERSAFSEQP